VLAIESVSAIVSTQVPHLHRSPSLLLLTMTLIAKSTFAAVAIDAVVATSLIHHTLVGNRDLPATEPIEMAVHETIRRIQTNPAVSRRSQTVDCEHWASIDRYRLEIDSPKHFVLEKDLLAGKRKKMNDKCKKTNTHTQSFSRTLH
jgi:hypothetical protein